MDPGHMSLYMNGSVSDLGRMNWEMTASKLFTVLICSIFILLCN